MQFALRTEFGHNFRAKNTLTIFSPYIALKYLGLQLEDYAETNNSGAGLKVDNKYFDTIIADIGFKVISELNSEKYLKGYTLSPEFEIFLSKNLDVEGQKTKTTFISGGASSHNTAIDLQEDTLNLGLGLEISKDKTSSINLKYNLELGEEMVGHQGAISWKIKF